MYRIIICVCGILFLVLVNGEASAQDGLRTGGGEGPASIGDVKSAKDSLDELKKLVEDICSDNKDDDGDGFVDCADADCRTAPVCKSAEQTPAPEPTGSTHAVPEREQLCDDGDDDKDGKTDCDDPDCQYVGSICCDSNPTASWCQTPSPSDATPTPPPPPASQLAARPAAAGRRAIRQTSSLAAGDTSNDSDTFNCTTGNVRQIVRDLWTTMPSTTRQRVDELEQSFGNVFDSDDPNSFSGKQKKLADDVRNLEAANVANSNSVKGQDTKIENLQKKIEEINPDGVIADIRTAAGKAQADLDAHFQRKLDEGTQFILQIGGGGGYGFNHRQSYEDDAGVSRLPRYDDKGAFARLDVLFFRRFDGSNRQGGFSGKIGIGGNLGLAVLGGVGGTVQWSARRPNLRRLFIGLYLGYLGGAGGARDGYKTTYNAHGGELALVLSWVPPVNDDNDPDLVVEARIGFRLMGVDDAGDRLWASPGLGLELTMLGGFPSARRLGD